MCTTSHIPPPTSCSVDMAALASRNGSRYPEAGFHFAWVALQSKIQSASPFQIHGSLSFISTWRSVLRNPDLEVLHISLSRAKEIYNIGYIYRKHYSQLYVKNQTFVAWANMYQEHQ